MTPDLLRDLIHYGIHFGLPVFIARKCYRTAFLKSLLILWGGILIDIDHLWATPIFDPGRCSVGFHFLHQWPFIAVYAIVALLPKTRIIGIALLIHILADISDCLLLHL